MHTVDSGPALVNEAKRVLVMAPTIQAIPPRGLNEETCQHWGYGLAEYRHPKTGQLDTCHVATYRDDHGSPLAQKLRFRDKTFTVLGSGKDLPLYGQWLWRDGGKMVVITEGEVDALSVSQVQGNKWPVVSLPSGATSAKKTIQRSIEWLLKFDHVVLMFDEDEPGKKAAQECAALFPAGRCKIARLPEGYKDANDLLMAGKGKAIIDAIWGAKEYRPDGVVDGRDLWDEILRQEDSFSIPYPWQGLDQKLLGMRKGEIVTLTAGSGIGKSQVCRELAYHLLQQGEGVGYIALEENAKKSSLGLMGIHLNKRLTISREGVSEDELRKAFDATVGSGRCFLFKHYGSLESDNLLSKIRYMVQAGGCQWIVVDHLSIVVSGLEVDDERKAIDVAMTRLRSLVEELQVGMFLVVHLKRPSGDSKGFNEGRQVGLSDLRGSAGIEQLSDSVVGFERDQQNPDRQHITTVRVLKNRHVGACGPAGFLRYEPATGRLKEDLEAKAEPAAKAGSEFF